MKNLETTKSTQLTEEIFNVNKLEFGDVVVYNEMSDNTSIKLNLIEQLHAQLNQINELMLKRQFMMREVLQLVGE